MGTFLPLRTRLQSGAGGSLATAAHNRDVWRGDFEDLSESFHHLAVLAEDFRGYGDWPTLADYDRLAASRRIVTAAGHPVHFVPQAPKPRGKARRAASGISYEQRVIEGAVPTRVGHWHDFFNMLAWCVFPLAKAALNARQVAGGKVVAGARNDEQNRLAMFDEGGVVLVEGGRGGDPLRLVFGHAIHEGIVRGSPDTGGWTTTVVLADQVRYGGLAPLIAAVDQALAASIATNTLTRRPMR